MAQFLTTKGTAYGIEQVINEADSKLILLSPFLKISTMFINRLKDADNRKVNTTIVYGKDKLKREEKEKIAKLKTISLYYCENLHAKCYFNEQQMVLTSMNMYDFSEINNYEMGILINKKDDAELFNRAVTEAMSIIRSSKKEEKEAQSTEKKRSLREKKSSYAIKNKGFCIGCHRSIIFNPDKPYCRNCYDRWNECGNPEYEEKFCHKCGKPKNTCMDKPLCYKCFSDLR